MTRSLIATFAICVIAMATTTTSAQAQILRAGVVRNPLTGTVTGTTITRNPYTGTIGRNTITRNPYTGMTARTSQAYNPLTNRYGYRWGVRRF
jgi:hypothetical protein